MTATHRYPYRWTLRDARFTRDKGKVFSCFACGGGSTMGYKLAGFDVIGCNEIDPKMMHLYELNHHPRHAYCEPIQTFKTRRDLPDELYQLDILDGSPPCSTFSIAGQRERNWGREKKFREGQQAQVLDTLFFDFIELALKLQPKVVVAENVEGLLLGNAVKYVRDIYAYLDAAGYLVQHWLLRAETMGVPQRRHRVFFIALRKDLARPFLVQKDIFAEAPALRLEFNEPPIPFREIATYQGREITGENMRKYWDNRKDGDRNMAEATQRLEGRAANFNRGYAYPDKVCPTLTHDSAHPVCFDKPLFFSEEEYLLASSFPLDYDFEGRGTNLVAYVCGMSVPPVMMANVATEIYRQWLSKISQ
ncbi:MAG: DNA (cytosine-5-)-methyltransferase [Prevotellaceae bacterium]|nr:DNA (cytosine-5-)-methyltransferase [Prevotellaceae bacterium]